MAGVVGVSFEDGEGAVHLLQKDDAGEFMCEGHLAERERGGRSFARSVGESVGGADGQNERLRVAVLMILQKFSQFLRSQLAAAGVEQDDRVGGSRAGFFA